EQAHAKEAVAGVIAFSCSYKYLCVIEGINRDSTDGQRWRSIHERRPVRASVQRAIKTALGRSDINGVPGCVRGVNGDGSYPTANRNFFGWIKDCPKRLAVGNGRRAERCPYIGGSGGQRSQRGAAGAQLMQEKLLQFHGADGVGALKRVAHQVIDTALHAYLLIAQSKIFFLANAATGDGGNIGAVCVGFRL